MKMNKQLRRFAITTFTSLLLGISVFAQETIKGTLKSSAGEPLSGANISIKGKKKSVVTDGNGTFRINATPDDVLIATYVGYIPQEVKAGTGTVNMTLSTAANSMNDVVVVGYGSTSRKNLTLSISKVDPKNVPSAANNSVAQLLFGPGYWFACRAAKCRTRWKYKPRHTRSRQSINCS